MLRVVVLFLVLANASYFAWSQGLLASWGFAPEQQSEPHRLEQQLKPQAVRVLNGDEARRIEASVSRSAECVQAGLFTDAEADALKQALASWPDGSWTIEPGVEPRRWIVYMGKYLTADIVSRKKAELRGLGVSIESLGNSSLEPGLSLGGYPSEAAAKAQLDGLARKGVRTAKVVLERPESKGQLLKFPVVDEAFRPRLEEIKSALAGKGLRPCR